MIGVVPDRWRLSSPRAVIDRVQACSTTTGDDISGATLVEPLVGVIVSVENQFDGEPGEQGDPVLDDFGSAAMQGAREGRLVEEDHDRYVPRPGELFDQPLGLPRIPDLVGVEEEEASLTEGPSVPAVGRAERPPHRLPPCSALKVVVSPRWPDLHSQVIHPAEGSIPDSLHVVGVEVVSCGEQGQGSRSTATNRMLSATSYSAPEPVPKSPTTSATASSGGVVVGVDWVLVTGGADDEERTGEGDAEAGRTLVVCDGGALQAAKPIRRVTTSRLIPSRCD